MAVLSTLVGRSRVALLGRALVAVAASSALALSACSSSSGGSGGSGGGAASSGTAGGGAGGVSLIAPGKLTVCTHLPYAPFQANDDQGKTVGFDVDMMDLVAKKLGVQQAIVDTPFEGIKSARTCPPASATSPPPA